LLFFFFFQAEDGIRDFHVTGVQTCALPIFDSGLWFMALAGLESGIVCCAIFGSGFGLCSLNFFKNHLGWLGADSDWCRAVYHFEIGRASCRERVVVSAGAAASTSRHQEDA